MDSNVLQNSQALLATVLSVGGAYTIYFVKNAFTYLLTKTTVIKDKEARDVVNNALSTLDTLLETNITYAEHVLKKPIIDSIQDGKVTKDELKSLSTLVKTNVLSQLTDDSKTALSNIAVNVEDFVEKRLETVLGNLKVDDKSSVKATEISLPTQEQIDTASLRTQLTQVQSEKDSLTQTNTSLQSTIDGLNITNADLTSQIASLNAQIQALTTQNQTVQAKLDSITSAISNVSNTTNTNSVTVQVDGSQLQQNITTPVDGNAINNTVQVQA